MALLDWLCWSVLQHHRNSLLLIHGRVGRLWGWGKGGETARPWHLLEPWQDTGKEQHSYWILLCSWIPVVFEWKPQDINSVTVAQEYWGEALLIPITAVNKFVRLLLLVGLLIAQYICRIFWFLLCLRHISAEWHHHKSCWNLLLLLET